MKICFLAAASSIHTVRWVNAMVAKGHEVTLVTMHPQEENKVDSSVKVLELKHKNSLGYYLNVMELKSILAKLKPDLLNVHYASGYGTLGRLTGFQPILLSIWGSDVYEYPFQNRFNYFNVKRNMEKAFSIASTSEDMERQAISILKKQKEIHITPFGIDLNKFKFIPNKKNANELRIGIVKTLEEVYGIKYLVEALAIVLKQLKASDYNGKKIVLEIVGRGSQKEALEQQCKELHIDEYVCFTDRIPNHLVPEKLNSFDIFCAPSLEESFGVAIIEASACELPVVVTNVGGLKEVVKHNETGFIVESKNAEAVAEALLKLIMDKALRKQLGVSGRKWVAEQYDWYENIERMEKTYRQCISAYKKGYGI